MSSIKSEDSLDSYDKITKPRTKITSASIFLRLIQLAAIEAVVFYVAHIIVLQLIGHNLLDLHDLKNRILYGVIFLFSLLYMYKLVTKPGELRRKGQEYGALLTNKEKRRWTEGCKRAWEDLGTSAHRDCVALAEKRGWPAPTE
jgi:hypothetical protein